LTHSSVSVVADNRLTWQYQAWSDQCCAPAHDAICHRPLKTRHLPGFSAVLDINC